MSLCDLSILLSGSMIALFGRTVFGEHGHRRRQTLSSSVDARDTLVPDGQRSRRCGPGGRRCTTPSQSWPGSPAHSRARAAGMLLLRSAVPHSSCAPARDRSARCPHQRSRRPSWPPSGPCTRRSSSDANQREAMSEAVPGRSGDDALGARGPGIANRSNWRRSWPSRSSAAIISPPTIMLTGLPNRLAFQDELKRRVEYAGSSGSTIALLFVDLDRFKDDQRHAGPRGRRHPVAAGRGHLRRGDAARGFRRAARRRRVRRHRGDPARGSARSRPSSSRSGCASSSSSPFRRATGELADRRDDRHRALSAGCRRRRQACCTPPTR